MRSHHLAIALSLVSMACGSTGDVSPAGGADTAAAEVATEDASPVPDVAAAPDVATTPDAPSEETGDPGSDADAVVAPCTATGSQPVLDEAGALYRYAPSVHVDGGRTRIWTCGNLQPGVVRDHILYSEQEGAGSFTPWEPVLLPEDDGSWDSFHNCDPSVVTGDFQHGGDPWGHALFYSGNDVDDINRVQLGVAFSHSLEGGGQWTRRDEPLLTFPVETGHWGVGQPSAIALEAGRVLLSYSRAAPVPAVYVREVDLGVSPPSLGDEVLLSTAGHLDQNGAPDLLVNVDLMLEPQADRLVLVAPQHPLPSDSPNWLATALVVLTMDRETALSGGGTWERVATIDAELTGHARHHNAGLVRSPTGRRPDAVGIGVVYASSCGGCPLPDALFEVRLHQVRFEVCLPE